ncbi:uncharacterized protein K489DRAFT_376741 [Dissoconium aciculare CBS 342.82]|uniref:Uncharacterized protein n=1 Tax=Dissoconium aciculare CBS 342.82 TaxID=1314786 RepID=A0A6J3MHG1_9PEZI|nr:uncharacterized protein K489DRAFT_376741 [Dissoconium aciculare CBS 342.82]KAF1826332.1 hypothetical protein K489DRAFT_376741 [Dissoconium aciculare CBS 342.82]
MRMFAVIIPAMVRIGLGNCRGRCSIQAGSKLVRSFLLLHHIDRSVGWYSSHPPSIDFKVTSSRMLHKNARREDDTKNSRRKTRKKPTCLMR